MKFIHVFQSRASIVKKAYYDFELTPAELEMAKKATWEKPYFFKKKGLGTHCVFFDKGKLQLALYHSFDLFEGVDENYLPDKRFVRGVIHKIHDYNDLPSAETIVCGAKGDHYDFHWDWKAVTCKKCLAKRKI